MADKLSILVSTILDTNQKNIDNQLASLASKAKMTVTPKIDASKESVASFETELKRLADKIKLKLIVGVDKASLKQAEDAINQTTKKIKDKANINQSNGLKIFNKEQLIREGVDIINNTGDIVKKVKQKFSSQGEVNVTFLKNAKQETIGLVAEITKANGIVDQFKYKLGTFGSRSNASQGFILDSSKLVDKNAGKNLQDMMNKLQQYQNKIDSMKTKFTSPTTGIQDTANLANLNNKYNEIKTTIESTKNSSNNLSNEQRRGIIQNIADLNRLITQYKDLQTAQKQSSNSSKSTQDIELMVNKWQNAIKQMQVGKDKVFQSPTVQNDLSAVNNAINNFKNGTGTVNQVTMAMNNLRTSAKQVGDGFRNVNKDGYSFTSMLELAAKKIAIWALSTGAIYGSLRQLKEGFDFIKESSAAFTTLQMEMTDTKLVFKDVLTSANDYAQALGSTTSQVMKAIGVFSTYTSTMDEVLSKSKAATVLSNLTGESIESQADDIMGIMSQFKVDADNSMYIADTLAATARTLQIDYPKAIQEVSKGVRNAGSVAVESKASLEEFSAMIGVLAEKTRRSGSQVSNSLRTIFGRILNVGEEADPEQFKKVEAGFESIGVKIREANDPSTLRPIGKILGDLASKWNTLSDAQRQSLAFDSSGMYNKNIFMTLMSNYGEVLDKTTDKIESQGVAMQKQEIYNDSLGATLNKLKATWEKFWIQTANLDSIKGIAKDVLSLAEAFGNLQTIVTGFLTILALAKGGVMTKWIGDFMKMGLAAKVAGGAMIEGQVAIQGLTAAQAANITMGQGMLMGLKRLGMAIISNPIGILVTGIMAATMAMDYFEQKAKEATQEIEAQAEKSTENNKELSSILSTIEDLTKLEKLDEDQKKSLASAQEKIIELLKLEKGAINLNNEKREKSIQLIREESLEKLKENKRNLKVALDDAKNNSKKAAKKTPFPEQPNGALAGSDNIGIDLSAVGTAESLGLGNSKKAFKLIEDIKKASKDADIKKLTDSMTSLINLSEESGKKSKQQENAVNDLQKAKNKYIAVLEKEQKASSAFNEANSLISLYETLKSYGEVTGDTFGDFVKDMEKEMKKATGSETLTKGMKQAVNDMATQFFPKLAAEAQKSADETNSIFSKSSEDLTKSIDEKKAKLSDIKKQMASGSKDPELGIKAKELTDEITEIGNAQQAMAIKSKNTTGEMVKDAQTLAQEYEGIAKSITLLGTAQQEMAEGDLSNSTVQELIAQYPYLLAYMDDETKLQEQISILLDDQMSQRRNNLQAQLEMNEQYFNTVIKGNEDMVNLIEGAYNQDLKNFNSVADAKAETTKFLNKYITESTAKAYGNSIEGQIKALQKVISMTDDSLNGLDGTERARRAGANSSIVNQARAQIELLQTLQSGISDTVKKTESITLPEIKTNSDKTNKDEKETIAKEIELLKNDRYKQLSTELNEINALLEKNKNLQSIINERDKDYLQKKINLIDEEINLLTQKQQKEHEMANAKRNEMSEIQGRLSAQGAIFDAQGNITNQQALLNQRTNQINSLAGQINTSSQTIAQNIGMPAEGNITSKYGLRSAPMKGASTNHQGIDIGAAYGSAAKTMFGGQVLEAGYTSGYGNYVKVKTAEGLTELFGHLSKILVSAGQNISANTQIGNVGSTGTSTAPHLHYGISKNGNSIDPMSYIGTKQYTQTAVKNNDKIYDDSKKQYDTFLDDLENYTKLKSEELPSLSDAWFADQKEKLQLIQEKIELTVKQMTDEIADSEHEVFLTQKNDPTNYDKQIKLYEGMMAKTHEIADYYRSMGYSEESDEIQALQKQYWEYFDTIENVYSAARDTKSDNLSLLQESNPKSYKEQIEIYKGMQEDVHNEAEYYRSKGFSEDSEIIKKLKKLWWEYFGTIKGLYSSIEEEQNAILDDRVKGMEDLKNSVEAIQDKIVEVKRKKYEEDKDNELKALEETYNAFEKTINDKINLLDKEKSASDFTKNLSEKDKEIEKTQTQLNKLSLDDSLAGKKKRLELEEQLAEQTKDKQEFLDDQALAKRKENLQAELDESKTAYDKNVKQVNDKYDFLLSEENLYSEARLMIINKEWQSIQAMLINNSTEFEKGTGIFGDSIRNNIIENLQKVKSLMGEISGGDIGSLDATINKTIKESENSKKVKVNQGKAGNEVWETIESVEARQEKRYNAAIAAGNIEVARTIREETEKATGRRVPWITRFNTGGYTANGEGLAYLDKKEIVLNGIDTANILKAVDIARSFSSALSNFNIPSSSSNAQTVNMPITINVEKGSNIDENKLVDVLKDKIMKNIKLTGWKAVY